MKYNILPNYKRPILECKQPHYEDVYFSKSIELYEEKDYKESIIYLIKYINDEVALSQNFEKTLKLTVNQSQAQINIKIENDTFFAKAILVKTTDKTNKTAIYRKVAQLNFLDLMLPQIFIHDGILSIEYSSKLELANPYKIYYALKSLILNADMYLNLFVEKYNAITCVDEKIKPLSLKDKKNALIQINDYFEQFKEYSECFKEKRYEYYQWDNIMLTLLKLSNMHYLQGFIKHDLIRMINLMFDGDIEIEERIEKGNVYFEKLMEKDISKYIYNVENFMSMYQNFSTDDIYERLESHEETIKQNVNDENSLGVCYILQRVFLKLDYDFNLNNAYKKRIYSVLEEVSGKDIDEGARLLLNEYKKMLNNTSDENEIEDEDDEDDKWEFDKIYFLYIALIVLYIIIGYFKS